MKNILLKYALFIVLLSSCSTSNKAFNKKQYKRSKVIATYSGMANELQDGYLVLKENGYFYFYQKLWLVVTIKQGGNIGRYSQTNDTLYLNWLNTDPKNIKPFLSSKAVIDAATNMIWFIDEITNKRLWGIGRR